MTSRDIKQRWRAAVTAYDTRWVEWANFWAQYGVYPAYGVAGVDALMAGWRAFRHTETQ